MIKVGTRNNFKRVINVLYPMAEKYYNISPYAYCTGNPILNIDPNGEEIWILFNETINGNTVQKEVQYKNGKLYDKNGEVYEGNNSYVKSVLNDLNQLYEDDKILQSRIDDLQNSDEIHTIENTDKKDKGNSNTPNSLILDRLGFSTGSKTKYNPDKSKTISGDKRAPRVGLAHELLGHGWDSDQGKTDYKKVNGISMYEINAINIENRARSAAGNKKRTTYGKKIIPSRLLYNTHKKK